MTEDSVNSSVSTKRQNNYFRNVNLLGIAIITAISLTLLPVSNAYATSSWDNSIDTTTTLSIKSNMGTHQTDITHSFMSIMKEKCPTSYSSLLSATNDVDGRYMITQATAGMMSPQLDVFIGWSTSTGDNITFNTDAGNGVQAHAANIVYLQMGSDGVPTCYENGSGNIYFGSNYTNQKVYTSTYPVTYPTGYEGKLLPVVDDIDGDGLNNTAEKAQGTSDFKSDTDGDGLSDFVESTSYPDRESVFCDTSTTPHTCAYPNPTEKDIYVEMDWMKNGDTSYKPSTAQLSSVTGGLEEQGYHVHLDAGEYGGGNEIPNYIQYVSMDPNATSNGYFDLKNGKSSENISSNFNANRQGIWRYLISGYGYDAARTSSGATFAGSDNVFISYGVIKDNQSDFGYTDLDTAVAGTMVHELGHSLCMSKNQAYSYQSADCRYSGVDTNVSNSYDSVMNYNLQMFQNTLSTGSNGSGDHDDWGAISEGGVADFKDWDVSQATFEPGLTTSEAKIANKAGTLGKVIRNNKVYDLRTKKVNKL